MTSQYKICWHAHRKKNDSVVGTVSVHLVVYLKVSFYVVNPCFIDKISHKPCRTQRVNTSCIWLYQSRTSCQLPARGRWCWRASNNPNHTSRQWCTFHTTMVSCPASFPTKHGPRLQTDGSVHGLCYPSCRTRELVGSNAEGTLQRGRQTDASELYDCMAGFLHSQQNAQELFGSWYSLPSPY